MEAIGESSHNGEEGQEEKHGGEQMRSEESNSLSLEITAMRLGQLCSMKQELQRKWESSKQKA